ncbi:hypothetical protein LG634_08895 [Streptomyces bambusae]|uniref:hypothetical protein n=1 Tax=Streptomyces bambusae TaxID=1550616 RepID=UPI001CFD1C63|nr:hypothetical protein [Streptomyces bambusae]MCB5164944.1 hypothetical protein [Streptomyces bambusae]
MGQRLPGTAVREPGTRAGTSTGTPGAAGPEPAPRPAATPPLRAGMSPRQALQLQRAAGNKAVTGALAVQRSGSSGNSDSSGKCGSSGGDCCEECRSGPANEAEEPVVQRDFFSDAWRSVSSAGPAVARAAGLVADCVQNPARLPVVLSAIAWEEIPEALKGPLIDQVLRACLAAARTARIPGPPGLPVGTILQHVAIGALERALSYPQSTKVRIADRMARIVLSPSEDFALGFLQGLLSGLWDGVTGPFVLLWDLLKIGYEVQAAQLRLLSTLAHGDSRRQLEADVQAALDRLGPQISAALARLTAGRTDPLAIIQMADQLVSAALRGVEAVGAELSDALLRFMSRPDRALGEGIGWVAGTAVFEVTLLVLTEGGYTALKEALSGLRAVVRLVEAGAQAAEALAPARAALAGFRSFAAGNRALAPLVEAAEGLFALLVRYLRFSYGLGPAGGAARAGGRAAGRGASREVQVAETALRETHEITLLADGRLIRCSDQCMELLQNIIGRARALTAEQAPGEGARLIAEAERISERARAVKAAEGLSDAERTAQETALLREAASLERQAAAAEREVLLRLPGPARQRLRACRELAAANASNPAFRQFDARLSQLEQDTEAAAQLLADDPGVREAMREELSNLEGLARELQQDMRKMAPPAPAGGAAAGGAAAFDVRAWEASLAGLTPGERVARVSGEAERQAARHGFEFDRRLSSLNNRDVYRDPGTGHLYSVDTQHGRFEHCDARGRHQGEVNFDLAPIPNSKEADHSLRHL